MSFKNIIGQDVAIRSLKNIIAMGQVRGAYLFLGPDGVGKRSVGTEFAKELNCARKEENDCSSTCSSCRKIDTMNHPDVFMIYPQGSSRSIKIDNIRDIIYEASLKPYEGREKVFIINDSERMTEEAQNALLRLLEEVPQNHVLILTASNSEGLLPTVISRCKVLRFNSLGNEQIKKILQAHNSDEKDAELFSHMAMGSIGRAIGFREKSRLAQRDQMVNDFFLRKSALLKEDVLVSQTLEDIEESLYVLLYWYRDLLVSKFMQNRERLLNMDRFEEIFSFSGRFSKEKLQRDILNILKTIEYLRRNVNPKVALFNMAVELKSN